MITTPKQKEYFQKEKKMLIHICSMIGVLIFLSAAVLIIWTNYRDNMEGTELLLLFGVIVVFFLIVGSLYFNWEQKFKQMVFDNEMLDPNCYDLNEIGYKSFVNELKKERSIYTSPEEDFHVVSLMQEGTPFKVFISRTNSLIAEETSKMNLRCIERENHLEKDLSNDNSIRINLLFVDDFNFNAKALVSLNASNSISSKRYTNIVVDLSEDKLYVPAHFGINNMLRYKKLMNVLDILFYKFVK